MVFATTSAACAENPTRYPRCCGRYTALRYLEGEGPDSSGTRSRRGLQGLPAKSPRNSKRPRMGPNKSLSVPQPGFERVQGPERNPRGQRYLRKGPNGPRGPRDVPRSLRWTGRCPHRALTGSPPTLRTVPHKPQPPCAPSVSLWSVPECSGAHLLGLQTSILWSSVWLSLGTLPNRRAAMAFASSPSCSSVDTTAFLG